jgi:hypothetical protein
MPNVAEGLSHDANIAILGAAIYCPRAVQGSRMVCGAKPMLRNDVKKITTTLALAKTDQRGFSRKSPGGFTTAVRPEASQFIGIVDTLSSKITIRRIRIFLNAGGRTWSKALKRAAMAFSR